MAKFLKHLNLQICKYLYIFAVGSKQKIMSINQLKTHTYRKTRNVGHYTHKTQYSIKPHKHTSLAFFKKRSVRGAWARFLVLYFVFVLISKLHLCTLSLSTESSVYDWLDSVHQVALSELLFVADNLAYFSYQQLDEPLFVINQIDMIVSLAGSLVLETFSEVTMLQSYSCRYFCSYKV